MCFSSWHANEDIFCSCESKVVQPNAFGASRRGFGEVDPSQIQLEIEGQEENFLSAVKLYGKYLGSGDGLLAQADKHDCGKAPQGEVIFLEQDPSTHTSMFRGKFRWLHADCKAEQAEQS